MGPKWTYNLKWLFWGLQSGLWWLDSSHLTAKYQVVKLSIPQTCLTETVRLSPHWLLLTRKSVEKEIEKPWRTFLRYLGLFAYKVEQWLKSAKLLLLTELWHSRNTWKSLLFDWNWRFKSFQLMCLQNSQLLITFKGIQKQWSLLCWNMQLECPSVENVKVLYLNDAGYCCCLKNRHCSLHICYGASIFISCTQFFLKVKKKSLWDDKRPWFMAQ